MADPAEHGAHRPWLCFQTATAARPALKSRGDFAKVLSTMKARTSLGLFAAATVAVVTCSSQKLAGQPADEAIEDFVTTDGVVYAMTETNNTIYFGGRFSSVGLRTGGGVPVSLDTGAAEAVYPRVNGSVNAAVADGQGGWFIGGAFTRVGGQPRTNLARIRADRSVDPLWRPTAGGAVTTILLTGNVLYLGGSSPT